MPGGGSILDDHSLSMILNRLHLPILVLMLAGALSACSRQPEEAPELPQKVMPPQVEKLCNQLYMTNSKGKRISWKSTGPITFSLDPSFPPEFVPAIQSAMDSWNGAAGYKLFQLRGYRRARSLPGNDTQNTIYFLNENDPASASLRAVAKPLFQEDGTLAATRLFTRANQIIDADIIFNGDAHTFSTSHFHFGSYDMEGVTLHELGHALGLTHNGDPMSLMFYAELPMSFSLREIDSTSKKMLDCEYK